MSTGKGGSGSSGLGLRLARNPCAPWAVNNTGHTVRRGVPAGVGRPAAPPHPSRTKPREHAAALSHSSTSAKGRAVASHLRGRRRRRRGRLSHRPNAAIIFDLNRRHNLQRAKNFLNGLVEVLSRSNASCLQRQPQRLQTPLMKRRVSWHFKPAPLAGLRA